MPLAAEVEELEPDVVADVEVDAHLLRPAGFAHDDGTPNDAVPRNEARVTIEGIGEGRTRMSIEFHFLSAEAMEQMLAMRMEEGLGQAVGQIDAILAEQPVAS